MTVVVVLKITKESLFLIDNNFDYFTAWRRGCQLTDRDPYPDPESFS
jgi:hypothetical protein